MQKRWIPSPGPQNKTNTKTPDSGLALPSSLQGTFLSPPPQLVPILDLGGHPKKGKRERERKEKEFDQLIYIGRNWRNQGGKPRKGGSEKGSQDNVWHGSLRDSPITEYSWIGTTVLPQSFHRASCEVGKETSVFSWENERAWISGLTFPSSLATNTPLALSASSPRRRASLPAEQSLPARPRPFLVGGR